MIDLFNYLDFRSAQKKVILGGAEMYDLFGHHKYLSESELIDYYFKKKYNNEKD